MGRDIDRSKRDVLSAVEHRDQSGVSSVILEPDLGLSVGRGVRGGGERTKCHKDQPNN